MNNEEKRQLANNFLIILDEHIKNIYSDQLPSNGYDSMIGFASCATEEKLSKALYALLNIEIENRKE